MAISKRKTKNGVRWIPVVYTGLDPATGKRIQECGHSWELRREAAQEEAEMKSRLIPQMGVQNRSVATFAELVEAFKRSRDWNKLSDRTKDDYDYYLNRITLPIFGSMRLKNITYDHLQTWVDEMEKDWSAATLAKPFRQMKTILAFAVKRRMIPFNPCVDVELPPVQSAKAIRSGSTVITWTPEQITRFLNWDSVRESKYYPMLVLSFASAARPGEICGLWAEDFEGEYLTFKNGIDKKGRITDLKNDWAHRRIWIDPVVVKAIKAIQVWQMECRLLLGQDYVEDKHLFRHETGAPIRPDIYGKAFGKLLSAYNAEHPKAALPVMPLYNIRHSWATNARYVYQLDPQIIAAVMGHSSVNTSFENYINVSDQRLQQELEKMG